MSTPGGSPAQPLERGWWSLTITGLELTDDDRDHIAASIIDGYREGELLHSLDDWTEREPAGPVDGGDIGGDVQLGTAWERSWARPTPGMPGHWSVLTSSYYLAVEPGPDGTAAADAERYVQHQVSRLVCTNPADPGGSEVWSEYDYTDLSDDRAPTDDLARGFSERDTAAELGWDGALTQEGRA